MLENKTPLLSIIIPTKNRQHTCLFAIESALLLKKNDIEIIIQDCSDTNTLQQLINDKFKPDERISYEYLDSKPSMTDNWNRAFERACGEYKCGIGDDDAVLPGIYEVAKWAKENNIEAVGHSKRYGYFWPDYTFNPDHTSKLVVTISDGSKNVRIFDRNELNDMLKTQAAIPNMDYRKLPIAYHCLLADSLIRKVIKKTGKFLDATALDVYSAFSLGLLVDKYYVYDTPFTLPGACGTSNTNRIGSKKLIKHFSEFTSIDYDKRIPPIYNLTFTIAQSTQKALSNFNDITYSKLLDLPYLYTDFLFSSFNIRTIKELRRLMKENNFTSKEYMTVLKLFFGKIIFSVKVHIKETIKKVLCNFQFIRNRFRKRDLKSIKIYSAKNILDAIDILKVKHSLLNGNDFQVNV